MTDEEFEAKVAELVRQGVPEPNARIRVSVEAGEGGDVRGDPTADRDPLADVDRLTELWEPPKKN